MKTTILTLILISSALQARILLQCTQLKYEDLTSLKLELVGDSYFITEYGAKGNERRYSTSINEVWNMEFSLSDWGDYKRSLRLDDNGRTWTITTQDECSSSSTSAECDWK